jgi:hypothetical protein
MNGALFIFIFTAAIFFFTLESVIGYVSDFLIEQNTSHLGISLFTCISAVFVISSLVFLLFIKSTTSDVLRNSKELRILYYATSVTQITLVGLVVSVVVQITWLAEYSTKLLIATSAISPIMAVFVMVIASLILVSWFRFNRRSYVVLIFTLAFSLNAYVFIYTSIASIYNLTEKSPIITPESEVIYPADVSEPESIREMFSNIYRFTATANFILLLAGSAVMLRHYSPRIGRAKFWIMVLIPSAYYSSILLDALGIYNPESEEELFNYYIYAALNGIIGGVLLGLLFWSISRTMKPNKSVMNYLYLCSYGLVLLSVATASQVSVAAFPPYGIASFSMLPLSSYMIIVGLYSAATSISQDIRLRQYIRNLGKADSGFLSTIGEAQLEKKVQTKALDLENVVMEQRREMEKQSGIGSSIQEQDIKQYLMEVLQEVDKHKSSR